LEEQFHVSNKNFYFDYILHLSMTTLLGRVRF